MRIICFIVGLIFAYYLGIMHTVEQMEVNIKEETATGAIIAISIDNNTYTYYTEKE